jgi:hypothetical protein
MDGTSDTLLHQLLGMEPLQHGRQKRHHGKQEQKMHLGDIATQQKMSKKSLYRRLVPQKLNRLQYVVDPLQQARNERDARVIELMLSSGTFAPDTVKVEEEANSSSFSLKKKPNGTNGKSITATPAPRGKKSTKKVAMDLDPDSDTDSSDDNDEDDGEEEEEELPPKAKSNDTKKKRLSRTQSKKHSASSRSDTRSKGKQRASKRGVVSGEEEHKAQPVEKTPPLPLPGDANAVAAEAEPKNENPTSEITDVTGVELGSKKRKKDD